MKLTIFLLFTFYFSLFTFLFPSPVFALTPCTMLANPSSGPSPLTTSVSVAVDTTGMPDTKLSFWDIDGNGTFETQDNNLSYSATYGTSVTPHYKVVDSATTADLSETCSTTITVGGGSSPPSCTMVANPSSGPSPLTTFVSVSVDTTGMPDTKVSKWDLDGNGTFETTDSTLSKNQTYNTTTTPHFKVVDSVTGGDLSQTCSTTVTVGTAPPPPPPPLPPPPPGCGKACIYSEGSLCRAGNCLDGSQNCDTNVNCGFVNNCSTGDEVTCPAQPPPGGGSTFSVGPDAAGIAQIEDLFISIVFAAVGLGFIAMFAFLVWAGFKYLTSGGEQKAIFAAHQTTTWALLGVIFLAVAWLVLQLIAVFTGINVTIFNVRTLFP